MEVWAKYTSNDVAKAIGVPPQTLRSWIDRGSIAHVKSEPTELRHPGTGRTRLFNFKQVIHLGLVAALARLGIEIGTASQLALAFTHKGGSSYGPEDAVQEPARGPCELYPDDDTVFRVFSDEAGNLEADVCRLRDLSHAVFFEPKLRRSWPYVRAINLTQLFDRVLSAIPRKEGDDD